ncbi:hypothetical protein LXA43DRAFT_1061029 [Ganoderma leucocontextum]|nr:hypothetical protein LXA43DRAFT_1061029 [Ganoderma leucocontextum]
MSAPDQPASAEFIQEKLSTLLESPYIHFTQPGIPGVVLGPGPIDLFGTNFINFFTDDARGVVACQEVDKDGLKQALLALQKRWDRDSSSFVAQCQADKPATQLRWTQEGADGQTEVTASGDVREEGGTQRISRLTLDGDESLFS